jgi:tRNA (guanine37-N1)-methyltransferase
MRIEVLSLFPHYIKGPLQESILKRAQEKGLIEIFHTDIRDFADNPRKKVDDRPFGGGPGMVMMAPPVVAAIRSVKTPSSHVIYLSPQGKKLTSHKARELCKLPSLILLAGHYEGIDERALEAEVDEEISIGDYVLTNGCLAALVLIDAVSRFIPGVLGHEDASLEDSFENGLLDHPQYTKPLDFEGKLVPEVLLKGDHREIVNFRREKALQRTMEKRPDLFSRFHFERALAVLEEKPSCLDCLVINSCHYEKTISFYEHVFGQKATFMQNGLFADFSLEKTLFRLVRRNESTTCMLSFTLPLGQLKKATRWCHKELERREDGSFRAILEDPDGRSLELNSI